MSLARAVLPALAGLAITMSAPAEAGRYQILEFDQLDGWAEDDHAAALSVFRETCLDIENTEWATLCAFATSSPDPRNFFEMFFRPVLIGGDEPALFTGYFEPELKGSRSRGGAFQHPLFRLPADVTPGEAWKTRAEIEKDSDLEDRGYAIAYLDNPVDLYFLHVQGSGRIALDDGDAIRVGYAGKNGHEYRSIGKELVRRGIYESHQVSAQVIRNWVGRNPEEGRELLQFNPSYVFFREVSEVPSDKGPLGAMNRSITEMRSIAVDPEHTPLGAPVWIEKQGETPLKRLMIAQDTGAAIKGKQRADIFFGTGAEAGLAAGRIKDPGRMVVLLPTQIAYALAPEN